MSYYLDTEHSDQLALAHWDPTLPDTYNPSVETPANQTAWLVAYLENSDAKAPAAFTGTPPGSEYDNSDDWIPEPVLDENYEPSPDVDANAGVELLSVVSDADPPIWPAPYWENDGQYHGLGVPPGVENYDQPIEYGGTQAIPINPAAEHGWDAWSGRPALARIARHFNGFRSYSAGVFRQMGGPPIEKMEVTGTLELLTQQRRDLMLVALKQRGLHGYVVSDVPSVPFTDTVVAIDPTALTPEPEIGPEGVLP